MYLLYFYSLAGFGVRLHFRERYANIKRKRKRTRSRTRFRFRLRHPLWAWSTLWCAPAKKNDSSESWRACWERRKGTFRELIWKDLWTADMAFVMKKYFFKPEYSASKFGHLPKMALASKGMMASLMASSFCERINSCANIVVTKDNSLLSDEENLRRSTRW